MSKRTGKNDAVSEIIGTVLLLGISVTLFSIVYISVLSVPSSPPVPSAHIVIQVDGAVLSIGHNGGDSLDLDTRILISANNSSVQTTIGDISGSLAWDENTDNKWGMGEVLTYSSGDLLGSDVELNIIDPESNAIVMRGSFEIEDLSGSNSPESIIQVQYNLMVSQSGSGAGTVEFSPSGPFNYGDTVTIWANASTGSVFYEWTGDLSGSSSPETITMDNAKSVTATFIEANTMHVDEIEMSYQTLPHGNFKRGIAQVTIVDGNGDPVNNAVVSGKWSGLTDNDDSKSTDSQGRLQFNSNWVGASQSGTFTFTVTDVTKSGWTYDAAANDESSDNISV